MNKEEYEVYIDFMNRDKNFATDRKYFKTYEDAERWAKKEFDSFNPDMISYTYAEGGEIKENNGDITVAENKIKDLKFYPNYDAEIIEVGLGKKRVDAQIFFDADGRDYILINDKINYVDDLEISSTYAEGGELL